MRSLVSPLMRRWVLIHLYLMGIINWVWGSFLALILSYNPSRGVKHLKGKSESLANYMVIF